MQAASAFCLLSVQVIVFFLLLLCRFIFIITIIALTWTFQCIFWVHFRNCAGVLLDLLLVINIEGCSIEQWVAILIRDVLYVNFLNSTNRLQTSGLGGWIVITIECRGAKRDAPTVDTRWGHWQWLSFSASAGDYCLLLSEARRPVALQRTSWIFDWFVILRIKSFHAVELYTGLYMTLFSVNYSRFGSL